MKSLLDKYNVEGSEFDHFAVIGSMRPGDSYFVPELPVKCEPLAKRIRWVGRRLGVNLKVSATHENYIFGVRVWRLH